jgi:hypothetical protein
MVSMEEKLIVEETEVVVEEFKMGEEDHILGSCGKNHFNNIISRQIVTLYFI